MTRTPTQEDYQVSLDTFHGPLDLLLYLIRRAEVDIHDIPIAVITDQYLAFLKQIDYIDVDVAGEFLVMAATLIEVKSRTLMKPESGEADSGEGDDVGGLNLESTDPRYELVQQLLAYQRYRIASEELDQRRIAFAHRYPRRPPHDINRVPVIELELDDANPFDLSQAYERIMSSIDFDRMGDHRVEIDDTPIALHEEDLLDRLSRATDQRITLQEAFEGASAGQRVGLFLATLELVRLRRITVEQDNIEGEILLILNTDPAEQLNIETDEIAHREEQKSE